MELTEALYDLVANLRAEACQDYLDGRPELAQVREECATDLEAALRSDDSDYDYCP